jgi:hypothetical protein
VDPACTGAVAVGPTYQRCHKLTESRREGTSATFYGEN